MSEMYELNHPWLVMVYLMENGLRTRIELDQFPDADKAQAYAKDCADSGLYAEILRSHERLEPSEVTK